MRLYFILIYTLFASLSFTEETNYYYNPNNDFGSDYYFHPINTVINGSYDILRNGTLGSKNVFDIPYLSSNDNIIYNITNPVDQVEKFGVDKFVELEIFNLSFDPRKGHFLPNIANHVIGNGMLYVKLEEWYAHHQFPHPKFMALGTTTFYQYMNEIVEHHSTHRYVNVDCISDLLIFNPLGILLFSFDNVNRFFSRTMPIYDWSLQPMYDPLSKSLENTGQNYIIQMPFLGNDHIKPFVYWGIHGLAGLSYTKEDGNTFSVGMGRVVNRIKGEFRETGFLEDTIFFTPEMDGALSFFWDRNNSLLLSAILTGPRFYNTQINLYPGVLKLGKLSPGLYCAFGEADGFILGLSFDFIPMGLGVSAN